MLKCVKYKLLLILAISIFYCKHDNKSNLFQETSLNLIGSEDYLRIRERANDSLRNWVTNRLNSYSAEYTYSYLLDSLLCFNVTKDRFISCIHLYGTKNNATNEDLYFFYGEKLENSWCFYKGATIVIPREMVKNHPINKPLSYQQLHEIALKEVYRGYLKSNGEINEELFIHHFDNAIMNFRKYKNKEEYNKLVIAMSKSVWAEKFTPYTQESFDFNYNKNTKTVDFSFRLQTFDSVYCQPTTYKVIYQHKDMEYPDGACGSYWCDEIDWNKQKYAHVQLKNVPENSDVTIKIQVLYFPVTKSPVMGPFIFNTGKVVKKINS